MMIPFAEWRPDVEYLNSGSVSDIKNVLWADGSVVPFPLLQQFSEAVGETPLGGFSARASDGSIVVFVGTATALYKLNNTTLVWEYVSKLGSDIVTNGGFATDTDWNKGTGATIAAGVATFTSVADNTGIAQSQSLTAGVIYKVTYTVSGYSAGGVRPRFTGGSTVNGTTRTANGTYTDYITAVTGNNSIGLSAVGTTSLSLDNVSIKPLTAYTATISNRWRFRQFGDYVVAVNPNDDVQVFQIGTSDEFADLAGSPPRAADIAIWGDHLALLRLTSDPTKVAWSDTNDITEWTTGNSGSQVFPDGGDVQGATDMTNPIIFLKRGIWFGTFVPGSDVIFTFQKIHDKRGAAAPYSICSRSNFTFFADSGGFYQIGMDGVILPIGKEQVDRTIFNRIEAGDLAGIIGEIDPFYTRVYWAVKYDSTSNAFDRLIIYDWDLKKWTQVDIGIDILFPLASGTIGVTLEGLDAFSSSLDDLGVSLDSKQWQGGAPVMAAFDTDNKLGFFTGMNAEATIVTQEMGDVATVMRLSELYPVVDADNFSEINVSVGARMRRSDAYAWTDETTPSTNTGVVRKRSRARFHKFKLRIAEGADWTHAQGINVTPSPAGTR